MFNSIIRLEIREKHEAQRSVLDRVFHWRKVQSRERGWVRVMADYGSDGLWSEMGFAISMDVLPITKELRERLSDWCSRYELIARYENDLERKSPFPIAAFAREGARIARAIKRELPNYTVIYFDEELLKFASDEFEQKSGHPWSSGQLTRNDFEYEIR